MSTLYWQSVKTIYNIKNASKFKARTFFQNLITLLKLSREHGKFPKAVSWTSCWLIICIVGSIRSIFIGYKYHFILLISLSISSKRIRTLSPNSQRMKSKMNEYMVLTNKSAITSISPCVSFDYVFKKKKQ